MNLSVARPTHPVLTTAGDFFKMRQPNGDAKKMHSGPKPAEQFPGKGLHLGWAKPGNPHFHPLPLEPINNGDATLPSPTAAPVQTGGKQGTTAPKPAEQMPPTDDLLEKMQPVNSDIIKLLDARATPEPLTS